MPKLKTSKSIKKRFKISKTGKVLKNRPFKNHILSKKSKKRKRFLRRASVLGSARETRMIKKLLPYG